MNKKRQDLMYKLLEEMSKSLGYGKKIDWQTIQNPYIPKVLQDELLKEEIFKKGQLSFATYMQMMNPLNESLNSQTSQTPGDKKEK